MKKQNNYLIVRSTQEENTYGAFAREILCAEGLMGFVTVDVDRESWPELQPGDLALITRCFLTKREMTSLLEAVAHGANMVFLQPQPLLVTQCGGQWECRVIHPGYVQIQAGYPGAGPAIQTHLPVVCYLPPKDGPPWRIVAKAVPPTDAPVEYPAVIKASYGAGHLAFFFYDLAEAVARIRFGNPDLASYVTLIQRWPWPHAIDLFQGHLDPRCAHLPQADFHGQLLAKVLTELSPAPLARLWYYEDATHRAAAVFQSDDDMSAPEEFEALASMLERHHGTGTFYLMKETRLSEAAVAGLRARGHTFAPHANPRALDEELYFAIPRALAEETAAFKQRFGECSVSLQCHCAPWRGYLSLIPEHVRLGYRLLFAYISAPMPYWGKYVCGSGRPIRFFDRAGTLHDCWQQPIIVMDDGSLREKLTNERQRSLQEFEGQLQASLRTSHTAWGMLSHPISFCGYSRPVMEPCFNRLAQEDVPIYNADQWCQFQDRRAAVRLEQRHGNDGTLVCQISNLRGRLTLMIPVPGHKTKEWAIKVDGVHIPARIERRLEEDYLWIAVEGKSDGTPVCVEI